MTKKQIAQGKHLKWELLVSSFLHNMFFFFFCLPNETPYICKKEKKKHSALDARIHAKTPVLWMETRLYEQRNLHHIADVVPVLLITIVNCCQRCTSLAWTAHWAPTSLPCRFISRSIPVQNTPFVHTRIICEGCNRSAQASMSYGLFFIFSRLSLEPRNYD